MLKILVLGQTPPPYGGQAISIQQMLAGNYRHIKFHHVRMAFSGEMDQVGKFRWRKLFHLFSVILMTFYIRIRHRVSILYYVPAGPERIPIYRDFAILILTRWLFNKVVFQFRAAGISEIYRKLFSFERFLYRLTYFHPDLAIGLSEYNPPDGSFLKAGKNLIIPNGVEDHYSSPDVAPLMQRKGFVLLFAGVIRESKGIITILEACHILKDAGFLFQMRFMGMFESPEFRQTVMDFVTAHGLSDHVEFLGVKTGDEKWSIYSQSDILVFPSYFESEALPRVVLEAMMLGIPVVATKWRGIPSLVEDGGSGFLVPIKDSRAVANKTALLLEDDGLRSAMGKRGREIYQERFTIEQFWRNMEDAFLSIA